MKLKDCYIMHRGIETRFHRQLVILVFVNFLIFFLCEPNVLLM